MRMFWNASSTLLASRAEVSMKERLFSPVDRQYNPQYSPNDPKTGIHILANCLASSVGTALKCRRSLLFPTSMITMFESA